MIKPYEVTRERRYIGLPLGFSFLGISYVLSSVTYTQLFNAEILWRSQLLFRAFPFIFLALTYYSSKKRTKSTDIIWNIALSGFFVCLIAAVLLIFIAPQIPQNNYVILNFFVRTLSLICISYIFIYCINEQTREQDPYAKWVVVGYALLGLSQYSVLVWIVDLSYFAFWGSLISRLVGLSAFLIVAYKIFYKPKKKVA
jgi:FlaA1/EpsC-like NDP-sugar epimerase